MLIDKNDNTSKKQNTLYSIKVSESGERLKVNKK